MPGLELTPYDSADYLDSEEAIAEFLDAAKIEGDDDPAFMAHVLSVVARARARIAEASPLAPSGS